jgi:hypothetical protein
MTTKTRVGALLEKLQTKQIKVSKNQGGTVEYWPTFKGFEIVDTEGGDKFGTGYSQVAYQHFDSAVIIGFDNKNQDKIGQWDFTHLGIQEKGTFREVSDIADILKGVPSYLKKVEAGLYKRLPQSKGWVLDKDITNDIMYDYKIDADQHISLTIYDLGDIFKGGNAGYVSRIVDDGGYDLGIAQEREGEFTSLRDLEKLLTMLVKDYA